MRTIVDDISEVPEALHEHYEQRDGKHVLKLEGDPTPGYATAADLADAKGKVVGFRDNYTDLLKQVAGLAGVETAENLDPLKALLATFEGIDPEEVRALKAKAAELEKKGVTKPADVADIVRDQVALGLKPIRDQLDKAETAREEAQERADRALLREQIGAKALKAGARPGAIDFILAQADGSFEVTDDAVVAKAGQYSRQDAGAPLSVEEWLVGATKDFDFAFGTSAGGGADPKPGDPNPNKRQIVNPTAEQLGDPKLAKLRKEGKLEFVTST